MISLTNRIKNAFDDIHAEDNLKADTVQFLKKQVAIKKNRLAPVRKIAAVMACLIVIVSGIFMSYNLYFSESGYIDLDVNPSIEFTVNRFGRVIGAYAYNSDGGDVLSGIKIIHKDYRAAVETAIDAMAQKGYITQEALISITLQAGNNKDDTEMLANIETAVRGRRLTDQVSAFLVDSETRNTAHGLDLSPAKYLAILELLEVDPTATIESCRGHSIGEIYELTRKHSANHHSAESASGAQNGTGTAGHGGGNNVDTTNSQNAGQNGDGQNNHHGKGGGHGKGGRSAS